MYIPHNYQHYNAFLNNDLPESLAEGWLNTPIKPGMLAAARSGSVPTIQLKLRPIVKRQSLPGYNQRGNIVTIQEM